MKAFTCGAAALALIAAPLSAQSGKAAGEMAEEIDEAIHCAAVQTFVAAIVVQADDADPELETNLQNSTVRWLEYASSLAPGGDSEVMERYSAESDALMAQLGAEGFDEVAFTDKVTTDAIACIESERQTFGDSAMGQ